VAPELTIDQAAATSGTTTRTIRSFQSLGLLDPPTLRGRTGLYRAAHLERIRGILRLQAEGFTLQSLAILFAAQSRGDSLSQVLGLAASQVDSEADMAERYGFADLQSGRVGRRPARRRPFLSVVPTTLWGETEAS
jgi:DNA-binding transcriptional MerR regulator